MSNKSNLEPTTVVYENDSSLKNMSLANMNFILIPNDATNGDVISIAFEKDGAFVDCIKEYIADKLDKDWWDKPYKK